MKTIGRHLIAELYQCNPRWLDDVDRLRQLMLTAAEAIGAVVRGSSFHKFEPRGVSGTVVIAESHLSIHTWPQNGYVAIDVYTCGGLDPRPGCELLARALECGSLRVQEILRGIPEELEEQILVPDDVRLITHWVPATEGPAARRAAAGAGRRR